MVKNIFDISESRYTEPAEFDEGEEEFTLPTYLTFGVSKATAQWTLSLDNELIFGRYGGSGENDAEFWMVRAGLEKRLNSRLSLRCGLIIPVIARTDSLGNLREDIPRPGIGGSVGASATFGRLAFDIALFGDPARSYIEQEIKLKVTGSLGVSF